MRIPWILLFFLILSGYPLIGQKLDYRQGEILIEVSKGLNPLALKQTHASFNGQPSAIKLTQICAEPLNIWKITFDHNQVNEFEFYNEIGKQPDIRSTQHNYIFHQRLIPDDPRFAQQWQYINDGSTGGIAGFDTDAEIAWDITTGGLTTAGDTIVVCVIDDGLDVDHEDLQPNVWVNRFEIPDNGLDDDNNGYIDDYRGWDAIELDDNITRVGGHGTSVTGIVGAVGNNTIGVAGVNWNVKLMMVRGGSAISDAIGSYAYVYAHRKKYNDTNGQQGSYIVATNASWGFERKFEEEAPMLCNMYDALGEIGIISAGATINQNIDVDEEGDLPTNCSSPYLISVTNLTKNGIKKAGAGFGVESIDLAAPGAQVVTTSKNDGYTTFDGTSGASPHIAGLVGLMYSTPCPTISDISKSDPGEAALMVRNIILGSVTQNENLLDITYTGGHLNIGSAVTIANDLCDSCPPPENIEAVVNANSIDVSWVSPAGAETDILYRKKGNPTWKKAVSISSPFEIPNLDDCTLYEVQFRSACGDSGPYSHSYFYQTDNCCKNPETISVESLEDGISVSWEDITAAQNYTLQFKEIPDSDWSSINTTENIFTIPNLNTCSGFEFRISTNCSSETIPFGFTYDANINCDNCSDAGYCEIGFMDNAFEYIQSVSIDGQTFNSGSNIRGYASFIGNTDIILSQGRMVDVGIEPGFVQGAFGENMVIYVDWNQNGIFEMEEVGFSATDASESVMGQMMVPVDAVSGLTRMRVIMSFDNIDGTCSEDGLEFGEVEDYCVTVQSSQTCTDPVSIENINATSTTISLIWSEAQEAVDYTVQYREVGSQQWNSLASSDANTVISNLTKCTSYEMRVKANCSGLETNYSAMSTLTTRCGTSVIDPNGNISTYSISPNPFFESISLTVESLRNYNSISISVFDIQGRKILDTSKDYNFGQVEISDLDRLQPGIYLITAFTSDFTIIEKVVKL